MACPQPIFLELVFLELASPPQPRRPRLSLILSLIQGLGLRASPTHLAASPPAEAPVEWAPLRALVWRARVRARALVLVLALALVFVLAADSVPCVPTAACWLTRPDRMWD